MAIDGNVTHSELTIAIKEIEKNMESGFSALEKQITELANTLKIKDMEDERSYDRRYLMREQATQAALARLADPDYLKACAPIVSTYLLSDDGRRNFGCMIDAHIAAKRDGMTKWIVFTKLIAGTLIALALGYGGMTLIKDNQKVQAAVIEAIGQIGDAQ